MRCGEADYVAWVNDVASWAVRPIIRSARQGVVLPQSDLLFLSRHSVAEQVVLRADDTCIHRVGDRRRRSVEFLKDGQLRQDISCHVVTPREL